MCITMQYPFSVYTECGIYHSRLKTCTIIKTNFYIKSIKWMKKQTSKRSFSVHSAHACHVFSLKGVYVIPERNLFKICNEETANIYTYNQSTCLLSFYFMLNECFSHTHILLPRAHIPSNTLREIL